MKLLLINPRFPESFWSFKWAVDCVLPHKRAVNPPLGLATVAALTPSHWEVEIIDENVESIPLRPDADIVGVCGMGVQFKRQRELMNYYRASGYYVVAGGSYASLCPERYASLADTVIAGEAEYIWPQFCREYEAGNQRALYEEKGVVSLADSPAPRFDLLKLDRYTNVSLQFSRGCPFRCEFCDIIVMFGRKPRTKSREQIGRELDALRALDAHSVFFVDDNFIGDKNVAKDLLRYLIDYQRDHRYRFQFGTEASLNLAQDKDLLQLMPAANFAWVFIGIESPDEESLKETKKLQNTREDILTSLRRIYEHGLDIFAGFIIGFDHDTEATFERQYRFIVESGIQVAMIGLLTALPKTPLHHRLAAEGRLLPNADGTDNTSTGTNFIPKQIEPGALVREYRRLYERLLSARTIGDRIRQKSRWLKRPRYRPLYSLREQLSIVARLAWLGLSRSPGRAMQFARSVLFASIGQLPLVISEWITAISMVDFARRHLLVRDQAGVTATYLHQVRRRLRKYIADISINTDTEVPEVSVHVHAGADAAFYARTAKSLRALLDNTTSTVALHVDHFREDQRRYWKQLLRRLQHNGDRISVSASASLAELLEIDSSVFHLILEPVPVDSAQR